MSLTVWYRFERETADMSGAGPIHSILGQANVRKYAICSLDFRLYTLGLTAPLTDTLLTEISHKAREQGFEVSGPYDTFPRNF